MSWRPERIDRIPATAAHLTAARVRSKGALHVNRACQTYGSAPSKLRGQAPGLRAEDGSWECAGPAGCKRTFRLDRKIVHAWQTPPPNQREKVNHHPLRSGEVFPQTLSPIRS